MAAWDPSKGFLSFRDIAQASYVLLHCVRATVSGQSQLSASQTAEMLAWGQRQLPRLHKWLRDLEWTGLHKGGLAIPGDAAAVLSFPHIASHQLVRNIIDPLIALCSLPGGHELVSGELVSTVERAWSSARVAYPDSVNEDSAFVWSSGLDQIDARLVELKRIHELSPHPISPLAIHD